MPDDTTILSLPLILPAQAQKHVTHNEALAVLDLVVQLAVINRTLTTAPALPAVGDRHIVAAGATGPWAGQSGRIALYTATGWQFTAPLPGWQAHVLAEGATAVFDGVAWRTPAESPLIASRLGVSATPDATNRLAVSSPATLLNHAGAGHQLKLNKATVADTASLLFQTGFSARAEIGTAGADDFSVKVSADGAAFNTALVAAAASGEVTLPKPVKLGGQSADPVVPVDGTLWLNTTTGEVKVRSAGATVAIGTGGGGVADGDKGDITVSAGGTIWAIDEGAVTLAKLASVATDTFLGRDTAGIGVPEVLGPTAARGILNVADGATANAADAALRDRATHTGTQLAATISDFAEVAQDAVGGMVDTSLVYVDATPVLQRAALTGAITAPAGGNATALGGFTKAQLNAAVTDGDPLYVGDVTGNATHTGDVTGATALTIAADAVSNAKLANMANATLKGRTSAGSGDPEDLTGTQATALLDPFTSAAKGLAPASGGGTANFLRADGAWAAPAGGGGGAGDVVGPASATDNALARFDATTGKLLQNSVNPVSDAGEIGLPGVAAPTAPPASQVNLFGTNIAGGTVPGFMGEDGVIHTIQSDLGEFNVSRFFPSAGNNASSDASITVTATGTSTGAGISATNLHTVMSRVDYLVTTAATTAVAGLRSNANPIRIGRTAAAPGGFLVRMVWGPATGVATATHRAFCGLIPTVAPTDVNPSTLLNIVGMGYDAADANVQFLHNDGVGAATKIDLGVAFPKPNADRTQVYELQLFSPNSLTQSVRWRVIRYNTTGKTIAAEASGSVATDMPAVTQFLGLRTAMSVGGTSSVIGVAVGGWLAATSY